MTISPIVFQIGWCFKYKGLFKTLILSGCQGHGMYWYWRAHKINAI